MNFKHLSSHNCDWNAFFEGLTAYSFSFFYPHILHELISWLLHATPLLFSGCFIQDTFCIPEAMCVWDERQWVLYLTAVFVYQNQWVDVPELSLHEMPGQCGFPQNVICSTTDWFSRHYGDLFCVQTFTYWSNWCSTQYLCLKRHCHCMSFK